MSARGNSNEGVIGTVATGFKEGTQLNGRFLGENAGNDLDLMVEARIAQNVAQSARGTGFRVPCTENNAIDS